MAETILILIRDALKRPHFLMDFVTELEAVERRRFAWRTDGEWGGIECRLPFSPTRTFPLHTPHTHHVRVARGRKKSFFLQAIHASNT